MLGSQPFSFETPNVIDAGDLPPSPPNRTTMNTTSHTTTNNNNNTTTIENPDPDSPEFAKQARVSATRLLHDIRDLELQSQLPLPPSTIPGSSSTSSSTSNNNNNNNQMKLSRSQRLPFRHFPSSRNNSNSNNNNQNDMYDPYVEDDDEDDDDEKKHQPYSDHPHHSLPTSAEGLKTGSTTSSSSSTPYHQNRMGRNRKALKAPSKGLSQPAKARFFNNHDNDSQNLYDDPSHQRHGYFRAILQEGLYYIKLYRYRIIVVVLVLLAVTMILRTTILHHNHNTDQPQLLQDLPNFAGSDRYQQIVQYLTTEKKVTSLETITQYDDTNHARTPQNRALNWMVGIDALQYETTNPHFIQRYVLAVFFFATGGRLHQVVVDNSGSGSTGGDNDNNHDNANANANNATWKESYNFMNAHESECQWSSVVAVPTFIDQKVNMGVSCRSDTGDVTAIFLPNNLLYGSLPLELGFLTSLQLFAIPENDITGTLPTTLENWNSLLYLNMNQNHLTGPIPDMIGNWNDLEVIGLEQNRLTGSLPPNFGTESRLVTVALSSNQLTGTLETLRHLTQIEYLYVAHNQFTGLMEEPFFYNMKNIREIDVSHNALRGRLPLDMLFQGHNLHTIDAAYNNFTGTFPHEILNPNYALQYLNIRHNQFTGSLPETIHQLSLLKHFDVMDNALTGSIPLAIGKCSALEHLWLGNNPYTLPNNNDYDSDELPPLSDLDRLRELSLTGMNIKGPIPTLIHFLSNLELLDLSYNSFSGTIPAKVWSLPRLTFLMLNDNVNITGPLPVITTAASKLSLFSVHHTGLVDANFDAAVCQNNEYNQASVETGSGGVLVFADCQSGCTSKCCNDCCDSSSSSSSETNSSDDCGAAVIASYTDGMDHVAAAFAFDPSVLSEAQVFDEEDEPIEDP